MTKKSTKKRKIDLGTIDEISAFCGDRLSHLMLMELSRYYSFPVNNTDIANSWSGSSEEIKKWFRERGLTPDTVTLSKVAEWERQQERKKGPGKHFNRIIRDPDNIARFFNIGTGSVISHFRDYEDCPIRRGKDGRWQVDADSYQHFLERLGVKSGPEIAAAREEKDFRRG